MPNRALRVLYLSNAVFVFAGAMLAPIAAIFAEGIGLSVVGIGALVSVALVSKLLTTLAVRYLGDSIRETEYMLVLGFLLRAAAWGSLAVYATPVSLFIVQAVVGIGEGVGSPAFLAIFAKHLDQGHEVKNYADWEIIGSLVGAIAAIAGGMLVASYGFEPLFILMSGLAILASVIVLIKPRSLL